MTKSDVERERLGMYIVMPSGCDMSFMSWWKQLPSDSLVDVRIPYECHGNSGKPSNSSKTEAKSDFLRFVKTVI